MVVSYVGYSSEEVSLSSTGSVDVALTPGLALGEIVVTALGDEERRAALSYSTQKVEAAELNVSRIGDVSQQLAAQVPGLSIVSNNGSGVSSSRVVLRGEASLNINKNQP